MVAVNSQARFSQQPPENRSKPRCENDGNVFFRAARIVDTCQEIIDAPGAVVDGLKHTQDHLERFGIALISDQALQLR